MAATTAAVVGGVASAASSVNSMSGGGGGTPKWQRRAQEANYHRAQDVANGMSVAGFSPDQRAAMQGVRNFQGYLDGDFRAVQQQAQDLSQGVNPRDIRKFYNPFENDVVGSFLGDVDRMHRTEDLRVNDAAEAAGAFGGGREAVYRAVSQGEVDANAQRTLAGIRSSGYDMASRLAMGNHGLMLSGNAQLDRILQQRYGNRAGEIGMLAQSGAEQQAFDQYRRDLPQRQLALTMGAANQPTNGARPPGADPIAAGLHGFQGGYSTMQDLLALMPQGNAYAMPDAVPMANLDPIKVYSDPLTFGLGPING